MRFKDLATGEVASDEIPGTYYGSAWSRDGSVLFYVTVDDAWRPYRIWRHMLGTPVEQDVIVFEETDERFFAGVWLTRSERFVVISTSSKLTSEEWLLDASDPTAEPRVVAPRRQGVEYSIDHQAGPARADLLCLDRADNFRELEIATRDAR
jgi:oligopeptidase B